MSTTIPFHLPGPELEKWRSIAEGCIAVISITQRTSGFWAYPTIKNEVDQYYKGSNVLAFSDEEYGSYTVTWNALLAIEELFTKSPAGQIRNVGQAFAKNSAIEGARGRPLGGRTAAVAVDASPRHTAFALLTQCRFFPGISPREWLPSVTWLLQQQQLNTGGWSYRATDTGDQAFSTAACIAALAVFVARYARLLEKEQSTATAQNAEEDKIIGSIKTAISKGIERLFQNRSDKGFWKGHLGEPDDLASSANIVDLISMPEAREAMGEKYASIAERIETIKRALLAAQKGPGWPASYGGLEPALNTTIQVLFTVYDILVDDARDVDHHNMQAVAAHIASELTSHDGGRRLDSWDWSMLGRLCALILGKTEGRILPESQTSKVQFTIEGIRRSQSKFSGLVLLSSLQSLKQWDPNLVFVIARGEPRWERLTVRIGRGAFYLAPFAKTTIQKYVERKIEKQIGVAS